jgi:hypothetical protein
MYKCYVKKLKCRRHILAESDHCILKANYHLYLAPCGDRHSQMESTEFAVSWDMLYHNVTSHRQNTVIIVATVRTSNLILNNLILTNYWIIATASAVYLVRVPGCRSRGPGFDSWCYQSF